MKRMTHYVNTGESLCPATGLPNGLINNVHCGRHGGMCEPSNTDFHSPKPTWPQPLLSASLPLAETNTESPAWLCLPGQSGCYLVANWFHWATPIVEKIALYFYWNTYFWVLIWLSWHSTSPLHRKENKCPHKPKFFWSRGLRKEGFFHPETAISCLCRPL